MGGPLKGGHVTNCVDYSAITHLALRIRLSVKKKTLNQVCKYSTFSFPTTIRHQIVIKQTSSSSKLSSQQQATNTKTTNYLISLPPCFSLISDSESKIKKYAWLGKRTDRDIERGV